MSKAYALDERFKQSADWDISYDGFALTIDNYYENPEEIYEYLINVDYPLWKYNPERNSKNGIEYNEGVQKNIIKKKVNGSIDKEPVAIVHPITGGKAPAAPPITIF